MDGQVGKQVVAEPVQEDWYEFGFARVEGSRKRGVVSMPLPHAQTLLRWAGYAPSAEIAGMLVLDPACGSGNALLAAAQVLAARARTRRWGAERLAQEIEHSLWGLDPDPIACHVAELRLRRLIAHLVPDLPAARRKALLLHIHQTDSLVLPADARFHVVISNPPLATARGVVISHSGFESKQPPRDVWLRFLEQSMRLVGWGGALAIALPEALLTKPAAATLRAELVQDWMIERMAHLTGIFRSGPGTVMLLLRRQAPSPEAQAQWERIERLVVKAAPHDAHRPVTIASRSARAERRLEGTIAQSDLAVSPRGPWRYALGPAERAFVRKLEEPHGTIGRAKLGDLALLMRGAETVKDAPDPIAGQFPGGVPLLRALDVAAFQAQPGRFWLAASALKDAGGTWRGPRLVLPRQASLPQAALDDTGAVPLASLIVLQPRADDPAPRETLAWLAALLNAAPLRAWLMLTQTAYTLARPTIDLDALRELPVALGPADARVRIAGLALELTRHRAAHGTAPGDAQQYPISQRLEATLALEISQLYGLDQADLALAERWGS